MREMGLQRVIRGKPIVTTVSDKAAPCPLDKVNRQFHAPAPNRLWVSDFSLIAAGVSFSPEIGTGLRGVLGASGAAKLYRQSDWNDITVSGDAGLTRLFDRGSISGGLRLGRRWLGGDPHDRSLGSWFRARQRISDGARLDLSASAGWREHDQLSGRDGWRIVVRPGLRYSLDDRSLIEAEPVFEAVKAEIEHHSNKLVGLGATISRALQGGLAVSVSAATEIRRMGPPIRYSASDGRTGRSTWLRGFSIVYFDTGDLYPISAIPSSATGRTFPSMPTPTTVP